MSEDRFRNIIEVTRGLAACMVIYQHTSDYSKYLISDYLDFGKLGVVIFFMISGYLIPSALERNGLKSFVVGRFFRLYPLYWISIAAWLVFVSAEDIGKVLSNITMLQQYIGVGNLISVYWTLTIELFFYGCCVFMFLIWKESFINRINLALVASAFFVVVLFAFKIRVSENAPMALGLALYLMFMAASFRRGTLSMSVFCFSVIFVVVISYFSYINEANNGDFSGLRYPLTYLIALGLAFFVCTNKRVRFSGGIFLKIGSASYGIYLFHMIVFYSIFNEKGGFQFFVVLTVTVAVSLIAGRFVETPIINFSKRVLK